MKNLLRFIAIFCCIITVSALLAHLWELRGKINLPREGYQLVQGIYAGWAWLGIFEIGAILFTLIWAISERKNKVLSGLLFTSLILTLVSLGLFFLFTFPANTATLNWTKLPDNWELLRARWEYSHAARAILNLAALCLLITVLLKQKGHPG